jgi:succinate dehydrogenase / fumarate reductase cytochrome b subunit
MIVQLLPKNSVSKKILMAITGQLMVLFVIFHLLGNSTIYFSRLNAYAERLHALWPLLWPFRLFLFAMLSIHVFFGIKLYLENRSAKPQSYAVGKSLSATFASKNMIWTGLLIGAFLLYHLLHFTIQVINPVISASVSSDAMGRPDVFRMVVLSFKDIFISLIYLFAMIALALHLSHGMQSSFQTLGLNTEAALPVITKTGTIFAIVLFIGYISIPVVIFLGILKG